MTTPTMTLIEAANRLRVLAEAYHRNGVERVGPADSEGFVVSESEMKAVTFAAAFLGVFVESLENVG